MCQRVTKSHARPPGNGSQHVGGSDLVEKEGQQMLSLAELYRTATDGTVSVSKRLVSTPSSETELEDPMS